MVSSSSWIRQEASPRDWPVCASLPPGVRVSRRKSARSSRHVNCPERALQVKAELEKRGNYREIVITGTAGVATVYAGDGGIVLAVG